MYVYTSYEHLIMFNNKIYQIFYSSINRLILRVHTSVFCLLPSMVPCTCIIEYMKLKLVHKALSPLSPPLFSLVFSNLPQIISFWSHIDSSESHSWIVPRNMWLRTGLPQPPMEGFSTSTAYAKLAVLFAQECSTRAFPPPLFF